MVSSSGEDVGSFLSFLSLVSFCTYKNKELLNNSIY